jgi:FAD/FMN-containing dehydrogenase
MSSDTPDPARCADELSSSLPAGTVYPPGTDQYATSTSPDNTSFAQHPDAVVCPRTTEDVAATVALARNLRPSLAGSAEAFPPCLIAP